MLQKSFISLLLVFISFHLFAQKANCSFATEENTYLKVFLNNQLQNQDPKNYFRIENITAQNYTLRMEVLTPKGLYNYSGNINLQADFEHNYFIVVKNETVALYQANFSPIYKISATTNPNCRSTNPKPKVIESDFKNFKTHVEDSFNSNRLGDIKDFVKNFNFTSVQIAQLMTYLRFSDEQKDFAKFAYSYTCDPQNYYQVIEKITFSTDKEEVRSYINSLN